MLVAVPLAAGCTAAMPADPTAYRPLDLDAAPYAARPQEGDDPEATARALVGLAEERYGDGMTVTAEAVTERQRDREVVVLVTALNLPDDSVRDERYRVVLLSRGARWSVAEAGVQIRCREGRGHADWSPEPCL